MKQVYFILILSQFIPAAKCQTYKVQPRTENIQIRNVASNEPLWTNQANTIYIDGAVSNDSFVLTSSQGRISKSDFNWFSIDSLNDGDVIITAYKIVKQRKQKVTENKFKVKTSKDVLKYNSLIVVPQISLGSLKPGNVKLDSLKKITSIAISKNFQIVRAEFLIGHQTIEVITSSEFDERLKSVWNHLQNGTCVTIHNIQFSDMKGKIFKYQNSLSYCAEE